MWIGLKLNRFEMQFDAGSKEIYLVKLNTLAFFQCSNFLWLHLWGPWRRCAMCAMANLSLVRFGHQKNSDCSDRSMPLTGWRQSGHATIKLLLISYYKVGRLIWRPVNTTAASWMSPYEGESRPRRERIASAICSWPKLSNHELFFCEYVLQIFSLVTTL